MAEPITDDYLRQLRMMLDDGVRGYSNGTVASLVAKLDDYRDRLVKAENDLLNVRGALSPNGHPRRVPVELVPTVAAAVEWLADEVDRLRPMLADAVGYLAVVHRHANCHDVLGKDLGCAGCELLARIEGVPDESGRVPLRATTPGRAGAHFSPGYAGEKPDHLGAFETCPMPACATSRREHEAAGDIQQITSELRVGDAEGGA